MSGASPATSQKNARREAGLVSLEQLHAYPSCSNPKAPHLLGINPHEHKAIYVHGRCKMWSCRECGVANAAHWVARVAHGVQWYMEHGYSDWYMMTVTAHENWRGWRASLKNLRGGWRRLAQRVYRLSGSSKYARFFEHHKDGSFHMHFLTTAVIPYEVRERNGKTKYECQWLEDNAAGCGLGWNSDYRPVKTPAIAASYAAKYLAKSLEKRTWPKDIRRVQTSRSWPELPDLTERSAYVWEFLPSYEEVLRRAAQMWRWQSLEVQSVPLGRALNTDDFNDYLA